MSQAHENKVAKLVALLEEADLVLRRAVLTADEIAKLFEVEVKANWKVEEKTHVPTTGL